MESPETTGDSPESTYAARRARKAAAQAQREQDAAETQAWLEERRAAHMKALNVMRQARQARPLSQRGVGRVPPAQRVQRGAPQVYTPPTAKGGNRAERRAK